MAKGFYYIENSVDEYHSKAVAFFETLDEAKESLKNFGDWFNSKGTGCIYFQPFDKPGVDYRSTSNPEFICRGKGIDKEGNIIWSYKRF